MNTYTEIRELLGKATPGIVLSSYAEPGCIQIFADYMVEVATVAAS